MWALSRPVLAHCATNSRCERRAISRVTNSDNGTVTTVSSVSSGEIVSIITSTASTVSSEVSSWLIVIDSDVCDVVDVVGDAAEHLAALPGVEVGQRQPVQLVLDVGPQRDHGPLHHDVEQPGLKPDQQRRNQIQRQRQQQRAPDRAEVHTVARYDVHPRQQVGERVVATGPAAAMACSLVMPAGSCAADHTVEQQIGGVPEDSRADHPDRDPDDAQQDHRRGQAALWCQLLHQPDGGALEVAGAFRRCLHHPADRTSQRRGHGPRPTPAPIACESANSA